MLSFLAAYFGVNVVVLLQASGHIFMIAVVVNVNWNMELVVELCQTPLKAFLVWLQLLHHDVDRPGSTFTCRHVCRHPVLPVTKHL